MCPSIEGSLRELVLQIAAEENFNPSSSFINNQVGDATTSNAGAGGAVNQSNSLFGMTTQLKLGTRLSEMQESIKHIFEGQAQFRKELEHVKLDLVGKSVSRADLEQQLLLKANKQTVANALQRKANKVDVEPKIANLESVLMLGTMGNGKTIVDRLNDLEKSIEDSQC